MQKAPKSTPNAKSWSPASYGRTCSGCARAKCKCFYRTEDSACERCQRLGISCDPPTGGRKRKAIESPSREKSAPTADQSVDFSHPQSGQKRQQSSKSTRNYPSQYDTVSIPGSPSKSQDRFLFLGSTFPPDVALESAGSTYALVRPSSTNNDSINSIILMDISVSEVTDRVAEEYLSTFRRSYLPIFPLIALPPNLPARELRVQKPFFWLIVMAVASKQVSKQMRLCDKIWEIISKRIICEHLVSLDLLIGLICFGSWSHRFKKDKPFMTMISGIAVTMAIELGLHHDPPPKFTMRNEFGRRVLEQPASQSPRTLEERRTLLALFHLTSSTWLAYRKTEPMRWTSYMEACINILSDRAETEMDLVLVTQVKCQLITHQLDDSSTLQPSLSGTTKSPSLILIHSLLRQLDGIKDATSPSFQSNETIKLYLAHAELVVKKHLLSQPRSQNPTIPDNFQRLQNLDSILNATQGWLGVMFELLLSAILGLDVSICSQWLHCLVTLFKLNTNSEPGWDVEEIKQRTDVIAVLDRSYQVISEVAPALGISESPESCKGFFSLTMDLMKVVRAVFLAEMPARASPDIIQEDISEVNIDMGASLPEDFLLTLSEEPWFVGIFDDSWLESLQ